MQLDAPLCSQVLALLRARVAATLGDPVQGADPAAAPSHDPIGQLALQVPWQDPGLLRHAGVQLHPPGGSPHVLAAAALVEAAGDVAPAWVTPSPRDQHAEGESQGPAAGRRPRGTLSSQYRCASQHFHRKG